MVINLKVGDRVRETIKDCGFGTIANIFEYGEWPYREYRIIWDNSRIEGLRFRTELEHIEFGYEDFLERIKDRLK